MDSEIVVFDIDDEALNNLAVAYGRAIVKTLNIERYKVLMNKIFSINIFHDTKSEYEALVAKRESLPSEECIYFMGNPFHPIRAKWESYAGQPM